MRLFLVILLILTAAARRAEGQEFGVMFYNVENLFDTADDTLRMMMSSCLKEAGAGQIKDTGRR